jgi:hypothetical protein
MPHGREVEGLHLPPVPEAVNGEQRWDLGVLKQAGLVRDRHEGSPDALWRAARRLGPADRLDKPNGWFWQSRFDHLEDLLKKMDQ